MSEYLFDFNDMLITPAVTSNIRSRKEINPYHGTWLPIMVSPMDTVINLDNWKLFLNEKMPICFPRGITPEDISSDDEGLLMAFKNSVFFSYSLDEADKLIEWLHNNKGVDIQYNILIDIANGHIKHLVDTIKELKSRTKVKIMVGNIANPESYRVLSLAGADYIRVGIGFGGGCLTAMNTGIGYAMGSLVKECGDIKRQMRIFNQKPAKIIADGGFREYSDIIKALALGADYVMLGSMLNKTLESAGDTYWNSWLFTINLTNCRVPQSFINFLWKKKCKLEKTFRGMSTKEVQKKWGKQKLTTSEGVVRIRTVKYTLSGWRENFEDYLKSAMSYTDSKTLKDFIGNVNWKLISEQSFNRFNK